MTFIFLFIYWFIIALMFLQDKKEKRLVNANEDGSCIYFCISVLYVDKHFSMSQNEFDSRLL